MGRFFCRVSLGSNFTYLNAIRMEFLPKIPNETVNKQVLPSQFFPDVTASYHPFPLSPVLFLTLRHVKPSAPSSRLTADRAPLLMNAIRRF